MPANYHHTMDRRQDVRIRRLGRLKHAEKVVVDRIAERREILVKVVQFIWLLGGALEALIGLRIVLKFFAANPNAGFAQVVYGLSSLFLWPFANLTVNPGANGMVLEFTSMIALIVYALLTWIGVQVIWVMFYRAHARSVATYRRMSTR